MTSAVESSRQIGRYRLIRSLGQGAQGEVWLAQDPQLRREVAVKTVNLGAAGNPALVRDLLDEAVLTSQLNHPNIVTVHDGGQDAGLPYLVFEYVQGETLSSVLKSAGRLDPLRAAHIAVEILRALQFAHDKHIVHRDIKPANIMLAGSDAVRVMDFGIAKLLAADGARDEGFLGTPLYMAPEYAERREFSPRSDVFSAGMVLYAMLTGQSAVRGATLEEVLTHLRTAVFAPPSRLAPGIDERLDAIVLRALSRDPEERYESAAHMADELARLTEPAPVAAAPEGASGTLEFLLRRMQRKSDFPALSTTISTVNRSTRSDLEAVSSLAGSILKDFAFTHKLLKLVNTAYYGQFGGAISTISRAIMVMGFDRVRSVAITLMLFEHLQNKAQADELKDEVLAAYLSALIARDLVKRAGVRDAEEAFICAMFSRLGRLLVAFYLYDEFLAVKQRVARGESEAQASAQVLGMSFDELGVGVARSWNFPEKLISSMRPVGEAEIRRPTSESDRLRLLSELATRLMAVLREVVPEARPQRLKALTERFGRVLGVSENHLKEALQHAVGEMARDAGILNFKTAQSAFFNQAQRWFAAQDRPSGAQRDTLLAAGAPAAPTPLGVDAALKHARVEEDLCTLDLSAAGTQSRAARAAVLRAGLQDISNALVGDFKLNDVLRIVLETMYRGMGFRRALLLVRDPAANVLKSRFGFGEGAEALVRGGFAVPLAPARDVFHAAISQGADIYIEDVDSERIRDHIPAWYRQRVDARTLALFPVIVGKKPVALFYGDALVPGSLRLDTEDLVDLKTLRNQAVLAIKAGGG